MEIKEILETKGVGQRIIAKGWVRNKRGSKNVFFISLNDGSTLANLQIVAEAEFFSEKIIKQIRFSNYI